MAAIPHETTWVMTAV